MDCGASSPYTDDSDVTGVCVDGRWLRAVFVNTSGTVSLLPISGGLSAWVILGDQGRIYVPMNDLDILQRAKGQRVRFQGALRSDVKPPVVGGVTIQLSVIGR